MATATTTTAAPPNDSTKPAPTAGNGNGNAPAATSTAIAKAKPTNLKAWISGPDFLDAVAKALPKHITPERFVRISLSALLRQPKLYDCEMMSVIDCLLKISQYGLEPDGRRCHLIPFDTSVKINGKWEKRLICTLIIDYKGLAELVLRSGIVSYLHAAQVHRGDIFVFSKGELQDHIPWFLRDPGSRPAQKGEVYAVYSLVKMKDGTEKAEVLAIEEAYSIRDNSQGWKAFKSGRAKQSPWNPENPVSEAEMQKKTAFRRLSKWLPLSPEIQQVLDDEDDLPDVSGPGTIITTAVSGVTQSEGLAAAMRAAAEAQGDDQATSDNGDAGRQPGDDDFPTFDDAGNGGATDGGEISPKANELLTKINAAEGNMTALSNLFGDALGLFGSRADCRDENGLLIFARLDELIAAAKSRRK